MLAARSMINSAMHTTGAKTHNSASAQNSSRSGFSSGGTKINTNRFGTNPPPKSGGSSPKPQGGKTVDKEKPTGKNSNAPKPKNERGRNSKGSAGFGGKQASGRNKNNTFGAVARQGTVRHNPNPERFGKNASPPAPEEKDIPNEAVKDNEQDRK